jgi:hypothetical protein
LGDVGGMPRFGEGAAYGAGTAVRRKEHERARKHTNSTRRETRDERCRTNKTNPRDGEA